MSFKKIVGLISASALGSVLCGTGCSSSSNAQAPEDAGTKLDAAAPQRDTGTVGALPDVFSSTPDAGACGPAVVTGFTPVAVTPSVVHACTAAQITAFVTACFDPNQTTGACQTWLSNPDNMQCQEGCISLYSSTAVTPGAGAPPPPTAPWAPLIVILNPGESDWFNIGGCVGVADPSAAGQACAKAFEERFECDYYSCVESCTVPSTGATVADQTAVQNCFSDADNGPCATYLNTIGTACSALLDAGPESFCLNGNLQSTDSATADAAFVQFLTQQCGGLADGDASMPADGASMDGAGTGDGASTD